MTANQQYLPNEGQVGGNANHHGRDVIALELTEEMLNGQLVTNVFSSFRSKSLIVMLNHIYENKPINLPVVLEDWKSTYKGFHDILTGNGVSEEDSTKIQ